MVSILFLKPKADVTRSPKQEYQCPHKRTCVLQNLQNKEGGHMAIDIALVKSIFNGNIENIYVGIVNNTFSPNDHFIPLFSGA